VIPAVAGIMHMNPYHFYFVNILSAIAWAPVVLLPGVVFGSSLHLASEVAFRLVIIILLLVALAWLFIVGLRTVVTPLLFKLFGRWESHWDFVVRNAFNSAVVLLLIVLIGGVYFTYISNSSSHRQIQAVSDETLWWQSAWQDLPAYREPVSQEDPLTVQWWGEPGYIQSTLQKQNWQPANTLSLQNAIMWISPSPQIELLPLLSKRFQGNIESLLWVKKLHEHQQLILRMWPVERRKAELQSSLWLGSVTIMELKQPYPKFFYPRTINDFNTVAHQLLAQLPSNVYTKQVARAVSDDNWSGNVLLIKSQ